MRHFAPFSFLYVFLWLCFFVSFVLELLQIFFDNPLKLSGFFSTSLPLIPVLSHFFPHHIFPLLSISLAVVYFFFFFFFLYGPLAALLSDSLFEVKLSPYDEESQA